MDDILPGKTRWETHQHRLDQGHRAAVIAAHRAFADLLETDEGAPVPAGKDIIVATAPSEAAVDRFAAKHHVTTERNGPLYKATVHFGPELKFTVIYRSARDLGEHLNAMDAAGAAPEMAGAAA